MLRHLIILLSLSVVAFATDTENSLKKGLLRPDNNDQSTAQASSRDNTPGDLHIEYDDLSQGSIRDQITLSRLLCDAVRDFQGDFTRIIALLNEGADYNKPRYGLTALMSAVELGKVEVVRFFLKRGPSIRSIDTKDTLIGWTALQRAVEPSKSVPENDALIIIELLLNHGANPMLVTRTGQTCFELARDPEIITVLEEYRNKNRRSYLLKK